MDQFKKKILENESFLLKKIFIPSLIANRY